MAFTPTDYTFPDAVFLDIQDDKMFSGIYYQTEANIPIFRTGTVLHYDCDDFDSAVNIDAASAYKKHLFSFQNGLSIDASIYSTGTHTDADPIHIDIIGTAADGVTTTNDYGRLNFTCSGTSIEGAVSSTGQLIKTFGFSLCPITDYYDVNTPPTSGVTPPYYQRFYVIFPTMIGASIIGNNVYPNTDYAMVYTDSMPVLCTYEHSVPALMGSICDVNNLDAWWAGLEAFGHNPGEFGIIDPDAPSGDDDPSQPGGGGGQYTGGGMGGYDKRSDPVDFPNLPTGGALSSGAVKAYHVSETNLIKFFTDLWSTNVFDVATFQKLVSEPLEALISLHCIPFLPSIGASSHIHLGNFDFNNELSAPIITNQYKTVKCGSVTVPYYWGSFLDADPYTKVEIYLPFIGIKTLDADDVIGLTLEVRYNIDVLTGDLSANIKCGQSVLYKFQGNCKAKIPVTSMKNDIIERINTAVMAVGGSLTGGAAGIASAITASAVSVTLAKTHINRSGDLSGAVGMLDEFTPYLIIHRPIQSLPDSYARDKGRPSNITATLSSLAGYTEVEYIHLTGISGATEEELIEIETLLKNGVII